MFTSCLPKLTRVSGSKLWSYSSERVGNGSKNGKYKWSVIRSFIISHSLSQVRIGSPFLVSGNGISHGSIYTNGSGVGTRIRNINGSTSGVVRFISKDHIKGSEILLCNNKYEFLGSGRWSICNK